MFMANKKKNTYTTFFSEYSWWPWLLPEDRHGRRWCITHRYALFDFDIRIKFVHSLFTCKNV